MSMLLKRICTFLNKKYTKYCNVIICHFKQYYEVFRWPPVSTLVIIIMIFFKITVCNSIVMCTEKIDMAVMLDSSFHESCHGRK